MLILKLAGSTLVDSAMMRAVPPISEHESFWARV